MKGDKEKCLQAGCDAYLTKPIEPAILVLTIAQFLSGGRMQDEDALFHSS